MSLAVAFSVWYWNSVAKSSFVRCLFWLRIIAPLLTREVVSLHGSLGSIAYSILNLIHCG